MRAAPPAPVNRAAAPEASTAPPAGGEYGPVFQPPPPVTGRRPPPHVEEQVRRAVPELFAGEYRSALYVGANRRRQHFLDDLVAACERVAVIEAFRENADFIRSAYGPRGVRVVHGDVRGVAGLAGGRFDVSFFWHGPEHLAAGEAPGVIGALESVTDRLVVLGMPHGESPQGSEYGNDYERHLWNVYPADMRRLGYETSTAGGSGGRGGNLAAWKRLG